MELYNELTSNEKYAITNLIDGIVTFIREAKYGPSDEEIIATIIKIATDNTSLIFSFIFFFLSLLIF